MMYTPYEAEKILRSEFEDLGNVLNGSEMLLVRQRAARVVTRMVQSASEELRTLRRELAARRAVDGWRDADRYHRVTLVGPVLCATTERGALDDPWDYAIASAPNYPDLATALGLDWEEKTGG